MWRSRSTRGRAPNKCSKCGLPTKNHEGPYGPRCAAATRSSAELANLHYGSYLEGREEEKRPEKTPRRREQDQEEGSKQDDGAEQESVQEVEEESRLVEEEEEVQSDEEKSGLNSDALKEVLKGLSRQMDSLQTQVNDLAKKQEATGRSPEHSGGATTNTSRAQDRNWEGHSSEHECLSMPRLMRENHSSPAGNYGSQEVDRIVLPRAKPDRVPGLRPLREREDLSRYCPVPGISEKTLKDALSGEYILIESFLMNHLADFDEANKPMELCAQSDGRVVYKSKRRTRSVYNFGTWLEAWINYSRTMINYHGVAVSENMLSYIKHIQDYDRRHPWKVVENVDVQNRMSHSGWDIEFSKIDIMMLFSSFDRASEMPNRVPGKCDICRSTEHYANNCPLQNSLNQPFPGNPSRQAGRGTRGQTYSSSYAGYSSTRGAGNNQREYSRVMREEICENWNDTRCYSSSCRRWHLCRGCGGDLPHSICSRVSKCAGMVEKAQTRTQQNA